MFNRFIGKKNPTAPKEETTMDMSCLNKHCDTLDKKGEQIQKKIDDINQKLAVVKKELAKGGSSYSTNRQKASQLLQQRKMYENQLKSVFNMGMNMSQTAMTVESMQMMQDQYSVMKEVSNTQSKMFKQINMNEMYDLSDKMTDMREDMDEFNEMMNEGLAGDVEIDENDLDAELAAISLEGLDGPSVAPVAEPKAPISDPTEMTNNQLSSL